MSYPRDIRDCAKGPSKGGLSLNELRKLAKEMGIDDKGLTKIKLCEQIEEVLKDVNVSYSQKQMYTYPVYSEIVKSLSFDDLVNLCQIDKDFEKICKERHIWLEWLKSHSKKEHTTALLAVIRVGDISLFDMLTSVGVDVNVYGEKDLRDEILESMGIELGHATELLGSKIVKETPLIVAIENNNNEIVRHLLEMGVDPDGPESVDIEGTKGIFGSPLKTALLNKNTEAVRLLLEYGADASPRVYDREGNCDYPLGYTLTGDQIILLLKYGGVKSMYEDEICPDSHRLLDDIIMGSERYIRNLSEGELREIYDLIIEHTTDKLSNVFEYYDELFDEYDDYSDRVRVILDYLLRGFKSNKKTRKLYKMLCKKQRGEEYEIEDYI